MCRIGEERAKNEAAEVTIMSEPSPPDRGFATTRWSLVLSAGQRSSPESDDALAELCRRYWYPLYAYIRRRLGDVHEARDLTQEFFARLLEKNTLALAQPQRGRFRSYLLTCCKNFLTNEADKARAQKRGGGRAVLAFDFEASDSRYHREPGHIETPERAFERQWALTLLEQVLAALRREHETAGKTALFEQLKPFLAGAGSGVSYADAARVLDMSEGAFKVAVHRLRRRYRELLRDAVAETLSEGESVDGEIRALFQSLG
jgi:RNA polymerase sigma factor (sigma-70 family)